MFVLGNAGENALKILSGSKDLNGGGGLPYLIGESLSVENTFILWDQNLSEFERRPSIDAPRRYT